MLAYQALIVRCERNYREGKWVSYDRAFRREALAASSLDWSVPNPRLYQEAFTGRARDIPRCSYCLDDHHRSENCPSNPQRATSHNSPHQYCGGAADTIPPPLPPPTGRRPSQELCIRYNKGKCRASDARCRYTHACRECQGRHPALHCPRANGRSRSPGRQVQGSRY